MKTQLLALLQEGITANLFSGAQVGLWHPSHGEVLVSAGHTAWPEHNILPIQAITDDVSFDLASLTKMLVTAPLVWLAAMEGRLTLDDPVDRWLPDWHAGVGRGVTVRHLLCHCSGLPAWSGLYRQALASGAAGAPARMRAALLEIAPEVEPGTRACYSDFGYMLLGLLVERCFGAPLDRLAAQHLFAPLQMTGCRFVRHLEGESLDIAAQTEVTEAQAVGASPVGQVHDENAWAMGGVAGHAGLFGCANDVLRFGRALLDADGGAPAAWGISSAMVRWAASARGACFTSTNERLGSHVGGMDTPSGPSSTTGRWMSREPVGATIGHLGFTGTSLWVDRPRALAVTLLTNRVHPSREPEGMRAFRVRFHEAVCETLPTPSRTVWPAVGDLSEGLAAPALILPGRGARELRVAKEAALEAGALAQRYLSMGRSLDVNYKGDVDLVTEADVACEQAILRRLKAAFPNYGVMAEESGGSEGSQSVRWIVDPIDGTTNFSHGVPHYCVCIALEAEGQLQLGVMYDPSRDELFYARRGHGAWLNGRPIHVSACDQLQRALAVTGFPYDRHLVKDNNVPQLAEMIRHVQGMRRLGSAGLDLAWIAAGRLDVYWELRLKPWDMAAGLILVEEAGGRITDLDGSSMSRYPGDILASCGGSVHEEAVRSLQQIDVTAGHDLG